MRASELVLRHPGMEDRQMPDSKLNQRRGSSPDQNALIFLLAVLSLCLIAGVLSHESGP
jgi:hypothetical protein